ncbi:MAG: GAF domain-containing protein, partial [Chloroflexota bacterium]|nr:GAF domain-containing protein [Chloroflexota bacterium]
YAGIFVLDEEKRYAVLQAGSGEAGQNMLSEGYKLPANESSMIGWAIVNQQARINLDTNKESIRFNNPNLPLTRSELAIPLTSQGRVWGAVTIQSSDPSAFDESDVSILQTVADNLASAINNAQLYQESQSNLEVISSLHRQYLRQAWETVSQNRADLKHIFVNEQPDLPEGETSAIEVPLTLRGQQIGNLVLETNKPNLTAEEKHILDALTTQAALALENARLLGVTQQRSQRDRIVSELAGKVQRATRVDEALKTTLQELGQTLGASEGMIYLEINE